MVRSIKMKISAVDQELILETFKKNVQGLSISELARTSGINRNKASKIADDLNRAGIINCVQYGTAKVYSIKNRSALHSLLEMLHEPWVIIGEEFCIIEASELFFRNNNTSSGKLLGQHISDIAYFAPYYHSGDLQKIIDTEQEGKKLILESDAESERWMSIRIALHENSRAILLVLLTEEKRKMIVREGDSSSDLLDELSENLPHIIRITLNEAFTHIAEIIHSKFPNDLIITLTIDEKSETGRFNDILCPKSFSRKLTGIIPTLFTREVPIHLLNILKYKSGRPYLHEDISYLLNFVIDQKEIQIVRETLPIQTISLIGIMNSHSLIGIFGIGVINTTFQAEMYQKILQVVSRYLMMTGFVQQKEEEIRRNQLEYQDQYRKIYSELSEKTLECLSLLSETHHFMDILYTMMDQIKNCLILTQKDGKILSANQTALALFQMENTPLRNEWFLTDILVPEIAARIQDQIATFERSPELINSSDTIIDSHHDLPVIWHILKNQDLQAPKTYICLAEPYPAPLIQYLKERGL